MYPTLHGSLLVFKRCPVVMHKAEWRYKQNWRYGFHGNTRKLQQHLLLRWRFIH